MRTYKLRPWVSRQNNFDHGSEHITAKALVRFSIDLEIEDFDGHMADMFRHALAGFLRIAPDKVRIVSKRKGSVKVVVELPEASANELIDKFEKSPTKFAASFPLFDVENLERIQLRATPIEANVVTAVPTAASPGHHLTGVSIDAQDQRLQVVLLNAWSSGDASALERLVPLVYEDLRAIARRLLEGQGGLAKDAEPTALIHDVYIHLTRQKVMNVQWQDRLQFFTFASALMRMMLVNSLRAGGSKRSDLRVPLEIIQAPEVVNIDVAALDEALSRLAQLDPRQSQIVEMRFFVGLSYNEIAEVLGISSATVKREWRTARTWLARELGKK